MGTGSRLQMVYITATIGPAATTAIVEWASGQTYVGDNWWQSALPYFARGLVSNKLLDQQFFEGREKDMEENSRRQRAEISGLEDELETAETTIWKLRRQLSEAKGRESALHTVIHRHLQQYQLPNGLRGMEADFDG